MGLPMAEFSEGQGTVTFADGPALPEPPLPSSWPPRGGIAPVHQPLLAALLASIPEETTVPLPRTVPR